MAKVNFKRIQNSSQIDNLPVEDGAFIVTGDGKSYIDYGNDRMPTNGTLDTEMSDTSRNAVENKVIKKYVDGNISDINDDLGYEIVTSGEWTYKKYNNGLIEMWHKHVKSYSSSDQYAGSPVRWTTTEVFNFPITLTEMISINSIIGSSGHLMGCNITGSGVSQTSYQLFIYDYGQSFNQSIAIYTTIIGKWKEVIE